MQTSHGLTMQKLIRYAIVLVVLVAVALVTTDAMACPTCKDGMSGPESQAIARGYFFSILFMMAMPFVIIGTFGSAAYFSIRRAREQQEAQQTIDSDS